MLSGTALSGVAGDLALGAPGDANRTTENKTTTANQNTAANQNTVETSPAL